jgi:tetratricopeptide (TPR) repeat protein
MEPVKIQPFPKSRRDWLAMAALAILSFGVFVPALNYPFVTFDDPYYVFLNSNVLCGLTADSFRWAWTSVEQANWHPLTWLTLQLDATLWRNPDGTVNPHGFHLTSVLLHTANTALLFVVLRAFTGAFWRSAIATLFFAIHPLRVESVAWVAERKDVLSVFFGLLALWARAAYLAAPSLWRYLLIALALALSLMSKPMMVTLPFLFLVLDWWPLQRARRLGDWPRLVLEQVPLLVMVAVSAVVTYIAQANYGTVLNLEKMPFHLRLENALVSYVQYLIKSFFPVGLGVFYPHPGTNLPIWKVVGAAGILVIITLAAIFYRRRAPYLLSGWLWYMGTLVPVIGLVQVGIQSMADRYSYFPQIGILIALCWGVADLATAYAREAAVAAFVAGAALLVITHAQLAYWRDSVDLFEHTIRVAGESSTSLVSLGRAYEDKGYLSEALGNYEKAVAGEPDYYLGLVSLGGLLSRLDRPSEGLPYLQKACQVEPLIALGHAVLGGAYFQLHQLDEAVEEEKKAIDISPQLAIAHCTLGQAETLRGNFDAATESYETSIRLSPRLAEAYAGLAAVLLSRDDPEGAITQLNTALRYKPGLAEAVSLLAKGHFAAAMKYAPAGEHALALEHLQAAIRFDPDFAAAHLSFGKALEAMGDLANAASHLNRAAQLNPKSAEAQYSFGMILARLGQADAAKACLEKANELAPQSPRYQIGLARVLDAIAATRAADGNTSEAAAGARRARDLAIAAGEKELTRHIEEQLQRYERGETGRAGTATPP